jgi:hypothetical protein
MSKTSIDIHSSKLNFRVHEMEIKENGRRFFAIEIEHDTGTVCFFRDQMSAEVMDALHGLEA